MATKTYEFDTVGFGYYFYGEIDGFGTGPDFSYDGGVEGFLDLLMDLGMPESMYNQVHDILGDQDFEGDDDSSKHVNVQIVDDNGVWSLISAYVLG